MIRFCLVFLGSAFLGCVAYAGDERGNGGDAVVCRNADGAIVSAEALDHYEARTQLGIEIDAGFPANSITEAVQHVLDRIPDFDITRKSNYQVWANEFFDDANFLDGINLVDIPDSDHIAIPSGCEIEQLVIQRLTSLPRQKRYTINQDIWEHLDDSSKVAMVIHEIIYRDALQLGHLNSINTRYVAARLLELAFSDISIADYGSMMDQAGFPVEETCESINYIARFSFWATSGPPRITHRKESICFVAGSKVELSPGTSSYLLSKSFKLPHLIKDNYMHTFREHSLSYEYNKYNAFEEIVATTIPGYSGKFEVGARCEGYSIDSRGRKRERNCRRPIQ